jgi:hypothetical protein
MVMANSGLQLSISKATVLARAERGLRDMRVSTVVKIAKGLGVGAGELLRGLP